MILAEQTAGKKDVRPVHVIMYRGWEVRTNSYSHRNRETLFLGKTHSLRMVFLGL